MSSLSSHNFYIPCILLSITYFRRQFLHKMWPNHLPLLCFIVCRMFLSYLTLCNISSFLTWSVQLILSIPLHCHISKTFQVFLIHFLRHPNFRTTQCYAPNVAVCARAKFWFISDGNTFFQTYLLRIKMTQFIFAA